MVVTCIFGAGMKVASLDFHQEVLERHGNSNEALKLVSFVFVLFFLIKGTIKGLCNPHQFNFVLRE